MYVITYAYKNQMYHSFNRSQEFSVILWQPLLKKKQVDVQSSFHEIGRAIPSRGREKEVGARSLWRVRRANVRPFSSNPKDELTGQHRWGRYHGKGQEHSPVSRTQTSYFINCRMAGCSSHCAKQSHKQEIESLPGLPCHCPHPLMAGRGLVFCPPAHVLREEETAAQPWMHLGVGAKSSAVMHGDVKNSTVAGQISTVQGL